MEEKKKEKQNVARHPAKGNTVGNDSTRSLEHCGDDYTSATLTSQ